MGEIISHDEASKSLKVLVEEADDSHIMRLARYIEQQRAASVRVVELLANNIEKHEISFDAPVFLKPGQSLAIIIDRPAEAAAGEGKKP